MSLQTTTLTPARRSGRPPAPPETSAASRPRRRGTSEEPSWTRPALLALLAATAVLYLWGLGASGWANSFYSAAAQAGSESWKAFFFGASDAAELDHRRQDPGRRCG